MPHAYLQPSHWARPAGLHFTRVSDEHLPFLAVLYASTREAELAPLPWTDEQKGAFLNQQFQAQHHHYRTHYAGADLLVVLNDQIPLGRVYVYRGGCELRLMDIALLPGWRGHGLGLALLRELLDEADQRAWPVTLYVEHLNPVRRLYQRLGFVEAGEHGPYLFLHREPQRRPSRSVARRR